MPVKGTGRGLGGEVGKGPKSSPGVGSKIHVLLKGPGREGKQPLGSPQKGWPKVVLKGSPCQSGTSPMFCLLKSGSAKRTRGNEPLISLDISNRRLCLGHIVRVGKRCVKFLLHVHQANTSKAEKCSTAPLRLPALLFGTSLELSFHAGWTYTKLGSA